MTPALFIYIQTQEFIVQGRTGSSLNEDLIDIQYVSGSFLNGFCNFL